MGEAVARAARLPGRQERRSEAEPMGEAVASQKSRAESSGYHSRARSTALAQSSRSSGVPGS